MSQLPQLQTPQHTLTLPSTQQQVKFRPFMMGEEKVMLMALESEKEQDMVDALRQTISQCTFGNLDVNALPMFDMEYIFLQLLAKSREENLDLYVKSEVDNPDTKEPYKIPVSVDIEQIQVDRDPQHSNNIELGVSADNQQSVGVQLKYPTFEDLQDLSQYDNQMQLGMGLIRTCLDKVYTDETVIDMSDVSEQELDQWLESLNKEQFEKIAHFFQTMPKITHTVEYYDQYADKQQQVTLEGLASFFT